jgi:hypothetical protein
MNKSFSNKPRRLRQRNLLKARSFKALSPAKP